MAAPAVPPVKKGLILKYAIKFDYLTVVKINFIFLEKSVTQGKKRSLESDVDDTKNPSPPRVSILLDYLTREVLCQQY